MVAHLDAVTSLAVDVNGLYLISGSKFMTFLRNNQINGGFIAPVIYSFFEMEQLTIFLILGHDCSVRLWNLETKTCVQEITAHRKKFDESIFDVAFHPSRPFIASAGADALAKVFVQSHPSSCNTSFPFPTTWNELEEKHNHKNIIDLISKVTDNTSKNNESKKYTKFQRNFKQEIQDKRNKRNESFKIASDILSMYQDELHNTSLKVS